MERADAASGYTASCLECDPGMGAPPHSHLEREAFYVLEGQVILEADGREHTLSRGEFFQVESHVPHRFENRSEESATVLNISLPAGHGQFFREADALHRLGQFTPENAMKVCQANGIETLGGRGLTGARKTSGWVF